MATLTGCLAGAAISVLVTLFSFLASAQASHAADNAVIKFPGDADIGRLLTLEPGWKIKGGNIAGHDYVRARGVVKLVPGKELMLVANDELSSRMSFFAGLPADSLACLVMNNLAVGNKALANIKHLTGLRRLELDDTDIGDDGLTYLVGLKNLEYLSLSRTLVKGVALKKLAQMPRLQRLQLDTNALNRDACKQLAAFAQLRWLSLSRSGITDADLKDLSKMPHAESIILTNNNAITDSGVRQLAAIKTLRRLELGGTHATPAALLAFSGRRIKSAKFNASCKNDRSLAQLKRLFPKIDLKFEDDNYRIPTEMFAPLH
jgi:hypothetical protein